MNYAVKSIQSFEKQAKRLIKKYPSLKEELIKLVSSLKVNPNQGMPLGKNCFNKNFSTIKRQKKIWWRMNNHSHRY